jgi:hypothetical protein
MEVAPPKAVKLVPLQYWKTPPVYSSIPAFVALQVAAVPSCKVLPMMSASGLQVPPLRQV